MEYIATASTALPMRNRLIDMASEQETIKSIVSDIVAMDARASGWADQQELTMFIIFHIVIINVIVDMVDIREIRAYSIPIYLYLLFYG